MSFLVLALGLGLVGCRSLPREIPVEASPGLELFESVETSTRVLFPVLTTRDPESGWIISAPRFLQEPDARRARAFLKVIPPSGHRGLVRFWVQREVFWEGGFLGLFGDPGWVEDGRDEALEQQLEDVLAPVPGSGAGQPGDLRERASER